MVITHIIQHAITHKSLEIYGHTHCVVTVGWHWPVTHPVLRAGRMRDNCVAWRDAAAPLQTPCLLQCRCYLDRPWCTAQVHCSAVDILIKVLYRTKFSFFSDVRYECVIVFSIKTIWRQRTPGDATQQNFPRSSPLSDLEDHRFLCLASLPAWRGLTG